MKQAISKKELGQLRRTHLGRYLFELNKFYKSVSVEYIQKNGFPELTPALLSTISQINLEGGTEMQELVRRMKSTKQAVSRTLKTCEEYGYIQRTQASNDGRALNISFLPKGLKLMKVAAEAIAISENEVSDAMGKGKFQQLKQLLATAVESLDLVNVDESEESL